MFRNPLNPKSLTVNLNPKPPSGYVHGRYPRELELWDYLGIVLSPQKRLKATYSTTTKGYQGLGWLWGPLRCTQNVGLGSGEFGVQGLDSENLQHFHLP